MESIVQNSSSEVIKENKRRTAGLVGAFIRNRRENLNLSQRALGQLFQPTVTTQFISNVERGVTPLPPNHVPTLAKALQVSEDDLMSVLEREYAAKLSTRLGMTGVESSASFAEHFKHIVVDRMDHEMMQSIYNAYKNAADDTKRAFGTLVEQMLGIKK